MLFLVEKNKGGLKKMGMFKEKRKLIFSIFLISCIFISMSLVSANDNITLEDGLYKEDYQNKDFSINDDDLSIDKSDTDSTSNDSLNKSKSFSDLDKLINADLNKSEIILNDDYIYQDSDVNFIRGILINKSVVINGNGHTIDAQNKSKIFNIHADNVIIKNITFMNANGNQKVHDPNGGLNIDVTIPHSHPVYIDGRVELNGVVYNSNIFYDIYYQFIHSSFVGGAIYCGGNNLKIISENTNTEYRKATRLTVKLLIYIIVFSKDLPEEEKIPIYKNYINNEISYIKLGNFYTKRLFFTANKLLLNYILIL